MCANIVLMSVGYLGCREEQGAFTSLQVGDQPQVPRHFHSVGDL